MWHVLAGQDHGDDTFVAVSAGHFVALHDLASVCNPDADHHRDAWRQLGTVFLLADADFDDFAFFAMGHSEAGVFGVARLFTEDGSEELLLGGEFGLALGCDLSDEDVAWTDPSSWDDNAFFVEVCQIGLADVGNIASDFFWPKLGFAGFYLVFLDVRGGKAVVFDEVLAEDDRILIVAAAPAHEADQDVLTQREAPAFGRGAIGDGLSGVDALSFGDDGVLIDAGALV